MREAFFMQVYKDQPQALQAIEQLRSVYPDSLVIVRSDGGGDDYQAAFEELDVEFHSEPRRFLFEFGGYCSHRMLQLWSKHKTQFLYKIDPDTYVKKKISGIKHFMGIFGTLQYGSSKNIRSIQGGCIGFTAAAARAILVSKLLLHSRLVNLRLPFGYRQAMVSRKKTGLASFDWPIGWACHTLGIPIEQCFEISSKWHTEPLNDGLQAFLHPWSFE